MEKTITSKEFDKAVVATITELVKKAEDDGQNKVASGLMLSSMLFSAVLSKNLFGESKEALNNIKK